MNNDDTMYEAEAIIQVDQDDPDTVRIRRSFAFDPWIERVSPALAADVSPMTQMPALYYKGLVLGSRHF